MELERLSVVVRPRSRWEAVDLGLLMARRWWWPLALAWMVVSAPVLLLGLLFFSTYPYALLLVWWLKPFWERALLHILSHALFGELPSLATTLKSYPKLAAKDWFATLTWRRFSLTRALDAPVLQLEGLTGTPRAKRLQVLHGGKNTGAGWLMMVALHAEELLAMSVFVLVLAMIPEEMNVRWWDMAYAYMDDNHVYGVLAGYFAMAVVAPFYVAAGFSLYLHRRIWLEGWDIELVFRRLQARADGLKTVLLAVLLGVSLSFAPVEHSFAEEPSQQQARVAIQKVLADKNFHQVEEQWRLTGWENWWKPSNDKDKTGHSDAWQMLQAVVNWLATNLRVLLWAIAIALVLIFLFKQRVWLARFVGMAQRNKTEQQVQQLFGLDLDKNSLPADVLAAVRALIQQQQIRAAYALLYRAALSRLMSDFQVPFRDSYTELECVQQVCVHQPGALAGYFKMLTFYWQQLAYAHHVPDQHVLEQLCVEWQQHFEVGKHG